MVGSSLPELSAGVPFVTQNSVELVAPVPRECTAGAGPSMTKIDFPWALWPVTTRRNGRGISAILAGGRAGICTLDGTPQQRACCGRGLMADGLAMTDRFLLAAVMGWPISQSRSPMLHNFWFAQHGLAGSYVPLAVPPERLAAALRALPALNFAGCNLTIPLKQDAMAIVDEVDITARRIGAISCVVVRPDGSLAGFNNDWFGFVHNILEPLPDWRADAGPVAVMGAGGGARAVVYGLMERGAREIRLCNRTHARALTLAQEFR